jgi:hypothetical protein
MKRNKTGIHQNSGYTQSDRGVGFTIFFRKNKETLESVSFSICCFEAWMGPARIIVASKFAPVVRK